MAKSYGKGAHHLSLPIPGHDKHVGPDKYEIEDAARTLKRHHEIRSNKKLHRAAKHHLKKEAKVMHRAAMDGDEDD